MLHESRGKPRSFYSLSVSRVSRAKQYMNSKNRIAVLKPLSYRTVQLGILQCHMSRTRQRRSNKRNSKCALKSTNRVTLKMHNYRSSKLLQLSSPINLIDQFAGRVNWSIRNLQEKRFHSRISFGLADSLLKLKKRVRLFSFLRYQIKGLRKALNLYAAKRLLSLCPALKFYKNSLIRNVIGYCDKND